MKKLLCMGIMLITSFSMFSQSYLLDSLERKLQNKIQEKIQERKIEEANKSEIQKKLEKNRKKDVTFTDYVDLTGMFFVEKTKKFFIPSLLSENFEIISGIDTELLNERLTLLNKVKRSDRLCKVNFSLITTNPKTYAITYIEGLLSVDEYKTLVAKAEEKRLEKERIAEEKRLKIERIAEEKKRIAEEKRQKFLPIYEKHLAKAKQYEAEKRWCYALGSYYDALEVGIDSDSKKEAYDSFNVLKKAIASGNPGLGTFDDFTLHDDWKKLLIDAEKYGSSFSPYRIFSRELKQEKIDYATRIATYSAEIDYYVNLRYESIIMLIANGYSKAKKADWVDLPNKWPLNSASYKGDGICKINGAYVFVNGVNYLNAFAIDELYNSSLIDCKFNIVDEKGKELVKPKRCLLIAEKKVVFDDITPDVKELIDNGKAFVNLVGIYLQYGKYIVADDKGGRSFIKNFPEVELPLDNNVSFNRGLLMTKDGDTLYSGIITKEFYEMVMNGKTKVPFLSENNVKVSYYDAVYFCNKLSELENLDPVYSVDNETDVEKWGYEPNVGGSISQKRVAQNDYANGYRLSIGIDLEKLPIRTFLTVKRKLE